MKKELRNNTQFLFLLKKEVKEIEDGTVFLCFFSRARVKYI